MKQKITAIIAVLIVVVLMSFYGCGGGEEPADKAAAQKTEDKPIFIAGNLPLTGPIAMFCGQFPLGFTMGIDDACTNLNIPREKFKLDFQDNAGQNPTAVTVMQRQLTSEPQIYISGTSAMSDAIVGELSKKDVLHFLVSFDAFMTHGNSKVFRILPNFKIEAPLFLKFIKKKEAKRVFLFTPNLKAYLEQSDKLILPELKNESIEFERELYEFGQKDYRTIAAKANEYKPDVIVVSGYAFQVYPILKALKEYDLIKKSKVISTLDYIDLLYNDTPKEDLTGVWFSSPVCEITDRIPGYPKWRETFKEKYGKYPSYVDAYAYDTARILTAAYQKTQKIDLESLKSVLPFDGIVGKITMDNERDLNSTLVVGYLNEQGVVEEYKLD